SPAVSASTVSFCAALSRSFFLRLTPSSPCCACRRQRYNVETPRPLSCDNSATPSPFNIRRTNHSRRSPKFNIVPLLPTPKEVSISRGDNYPDRGGFRSLRLRVSARVLLIPALTLAS